MSFNETGRFPTPPLAVWVVGSNAVLPRRVRGHRRGTPSFVTIMDGGGDAVTGGRVQGNLFSIHPPSALMVTVRGLLQAVEIMHQT